MRVNEIRVKRIRVNQGINYHLPKKYMFVLLKKVAKSQKLFRFRPKNINIICVRQILNSYQNLFTNINVQFISYFCLWFLVAIYQKPIDENMG